ncbi:hypothetical protein HDU67_007342 [Dinochytrium kinnereticum]|nr:hypothetical protein HDU67_007342 [Dinochytrium kinnereticum]
MAAGLYAVAESFSFMAIVGDYDSLNFSNELIVGAWLCLTVVQNAVFLPVAAVANLLLHESSRHQEIYGCCLDHEAILDVVGRHRLSIVNVLIQTFLGHGSFIKILIPSGLGAIMSQPEDINDALQGQPPVRVALGLLCIIVTVLELVVPHILSNYTISPVCSPAGAYLRNVDGAIWIQSRGLGDSLQSSRLWAEWLGTPPGRVLFFFLRFQVLIGIGLVTILTFMAVDGSSLEALAESIHVEHLEISVHEGLTKDQQELCEAIIIASTYTSANIIEDVMDTSKFESGTVNLTVRPCDVVTLYSGMAIQTLGGTDDSADSVSEKYIRRDAFGLAVLDR